MPFVNFASIQEQRDRESYAQEMAAHETVATLPDEKAGRKTPTMRPPRGQEAVFGSLQSQIDSLHTTVSLLMEKYDFVEQRAMMAEQKVGSLLELRDLGQRERSQASLRQRTSSR